MQIKFKTFRLISGTNLLLDQRGALISVAQSTKQIHFNSNVVNILYCAS